MNKSTYCVLSFILGAFTMNVAVISLLQANVDDSTPAVMMRAHKKQFCVVIGVNPKEYKWSSFTDPSSLAVISFQSETDYEAARKVLLASEVMKPAKR